MAWADVRDPALPEWLLRPWRVLCRAVPLPLWIRGPRLFGQHQPWHLSEWLLNAWRVHKRRVRVRCRLQVRAAEQAASLTSLHFLLTLSHPSTSSVQGHRLLDRSRPVPEQLLGPRHLRRRPVQMQAGLRGRVVQRAPPRVHLSKRLLGCGRVPEGSVLLPAGLQGRGLLDPHVRERLLGPRRLRARPVPMLHRMGRRRVRW